MELKPYSKNAKKHPQKQVEQVAESIKRFGMNQPIVVDKDGVIIVGHGRYLALQHLGWEIKPEYIKQLTDLTPEEVNAYRLADNKLNESEWNMNLVMEDLKDLDDDLIELTGFDKDLIIEPDEADDEVPDVPEEPQSKLGDLYELGNHRVLCGDSINEEHIAELMNHRDSELLFTSPPYSDMREYNGGKDLTVSNLAQFIAKYEPYCHYQAVNLGIQRKDNEIVSYWDEYIEIARNAGYKFLAWNVWAKQNAGSVGQQSAFIPIAHEWIFVFGTDFKDINRVEKRKTAIKKGKTERSVRQADGSMKYSSFGKQEHLKEMESVYFQTAEMGAIRKLHPATFPIDLASKYIRSITDVDEIIVDPFLGSGSTLIAAEKTGRICYGMELDPKYVDVIVQRYVDYTGNEYITKNGIPTTWTKK